MSTLTFRSQGTLIIAMYDNVAYRVIPLKLAEQGTLSFEGRDSSIDHLVLKRAQAGYSDKKDEVLCFLGMY